MLKTYIPSEDIILKEYGRNIQDIVAYILKIEDRALRTKYAITCIDLMRQINPNIKDTQEHLSKLWDQLYIISNFQLDVDSEYPMPEKSAIGKQPSIVDYNSNKLFYKHYGKNIELIIQKAIEMTDPEEKEAAIIYLGRTMKKFYITWNKDNVEDDVIIAHIREMSKGKLLVDADEVKSKNLFDTNEKIKPHGNGNSSGNNFYNNGNGGLSAYGLHEEKQTSRGNNNNNNNKQRSKGPIGRNKNGGNNRFKRK